MIMMSNKCIVYFIAFLDIEDIIDDKRVLTPICELHQTFSYPVVYCEHFDIGGSVNSHGITHTPAIYIHDRTV